MSEPRDSIADWSEEELLLLRSAEDDRPSSQSLATTLTALGLGAASGAAASTAAASTAAVSTAAASTAAKWGGAITIAKWVSVVALGGAIAASGVALQRHVSQQAHSTAQRRATAKLHVARDPVAAKPVKPSADSEAPPTSGAVPAGRSTRALAPKRRDTVVVAQPDLSREIAAIDEARSALRRGSASDALVVLDRYDAAFAKAGRLQLEAAALRVEVLFRLGDLGRARSNAQAFLAKHPSSPYAARIRALLNAESAPR